MCQDDSCHHNRRRAARATRPVRIVAATQNPAKLAEIERLVEGLAEVESLPHDISQKLPPEPPTPATTPTTAQHKAATASALIPSTLVLATDGGLIIPALTAWEPTMTRRFAGPHATDEERAQRLLALASGLQGDERQIWWEESLAVARDGTVLACWTARSGPGILAYDVSPELIQRANGFWVSAIRICPQKGNQRLIELTPEERDCLNDHWNQLRHRLREFLAREACHLP